MTVEEAAAEIRELDAVRPRGGGTKLGWGPEDVIGGECVVVLEAAEDAQGTEKNKVVKVKPPRKGKTLAHSSAMESDDPEGDVVQIPL